MISEAWAPAHCHVARKGMAQPMQADGLGQFCFGAYVLPHMREGDCTTIAADRGEDEAIRRSIGLPCDDGLRCGG